MSGSKSAYLEPLAENGVLGGTNFAQPATVYVALFTDTNTTAQRTAGTVTEPSGNAYARVAVTNNVANWPAATGSNPASKSNGAALTFPTPAPLGWGLANAFGIFDAAAAGNLLYWGDLLGAEKPSTVAVSGNLVTCPGHGFVQHDRLKFSVVPGGVVPGGLTDGAYYYVLTGATTDTFTVSLTDGGAVITITTSGAGKWGKTQAVTCDPGTAPTFAIGALVIQET